MTEPTDQVNRIVPFLTDDERQRLATVADVTHDDCYETTTIGTCALDVVVEGIVRGRVSQALTTVAEEIIAELVCCDAYELGDHKTRHQICYWGGAAASLVRARAETAASPAAEPACGCYACIGNKPTGTSFLTVGMTMMIVCAECGNKRCPHGTDHRNPCTGSNDPGQAGSRYGGMASSSSPEGGA